MPCNPESPKAQDPRYECNQRTQRWNLKKNPVVSRMDLPLPLLDMTSSSLARVSLKRLRSFATEHEIKGRSTRDRRVLEGLILEFLRTQPHVRFPMPATAPLRVTSPTPRARRLSPTPVSSIWWKKCENEETLQGEEWKGLCKDEVVSFGKYCFTLPEIFNIIHTELTATDTSYQVPPLRLQVPRDPYTRKPFTLEFMKQVREKINTKMIPKFHEVIYFFHHLEKFYQLNVVKMVLAADNSVSKATLSMEIEKFLTSHDKKERLEIYRQDPRNVKWLFRYIPGNVLKYVRGKK